MQPLIKLMKLVLKMMKLVSSKLQTPFNFSFLTRVCELTRRETFCDYFHYTKINLQHISIFNIN